MTACLNTDIDKNNIKSSPNTVADSGMGNPLQLVWLTADYWIEGNMTESRMAAVNQRIHELGYEFDVVFQGISDESYETYQEGIEKAKLNKQGDLMWTGLGDGDSPNKEGTYYRQIKEGNLCSLNKWLKTDLGKKLKEQYNLVEWKRVTYKNKIYGVRNVKEQGPYATLLLTNAGKQGEEKILKEEDKVTISELCKWLDNYRKNPENKFYLDWRYVDEYNTSFAELGYIKLCDGVYMTPKGKVENIWENEDICKLWSCFAKMKQMGQLECDDSDSLTQVYEGNYPAALVNMTSEYMDNKYLYQPDGTKIPIANYTVAVPYLNKIENDVHGVTSWSSHSEEAMQLLTLVNTDKELANLLFFGEKDKDYQLEGGKVFTESYPDTYCPANPKITYVSIDEAYAEDKEQYYKKANEKYNISSAAGFVPDLKQAGANKSVLKDVEFFYKKLLEKGTKPEKMIHTFQKKLREKNYGKVLKKIQKQYDSWEEKKIEK